MPKTTQDDTLRLTLDQVQSLQDQAGRRGAQLQRKLGLPVQDAEDLRQELLVDLIARLQSFDPARGSLGGFSRVVMRNQSTRLAQRHCRKLTAQGGHFLPLSRAEHIEDMAPAHTPPTGGISLQQGLRGLTPADQYLCCALSEHSVTSLTTMAGFGSRSSIYRRIRNLRPQLALAGLGPGWDVLARA